MYSPSRLETMVFESFFLDKAQCCTYVGIKIIVIIPSPLSDSISLPLCLLYFLQIAATLGSLLRLIEKNNFSHIFLVTGALSLHNFHEVDIIFFPTHFFVRRLVPPPQVLLQSCQSPTCHLYLEGHGSTLHSCHAAGGESMRDKTSRLLQLFHNLRFIETKVTIVKCSFKRSLRSK